MAFTSHGHHIAHTLYEVREEPIAVARCGGPNLCTVCHNEEVSWHITNVEEKISMADNLKGIPFSSDDEGADFPKRAKELVQHQINVSGIGTPRGDAIVEISIQEIYVVWFAYTLGNWKAILSTSRPDGRIWEVTHKKERDVTFVDSYLKTHNVAIEGS